MIALVAAIPPPPFSAFHIGPLTIRMYGIMIGLGVLAGVWLAGRLFEERGIGNVDDTASIAVWGVFAGIIGARFYHVITDFQDFRGANFVNAFKFWTPGLGIPGGILFGTLAGIWAAKRRGIPILPALSCAAPAIPLAQAIGRIGNYFNQELYGRPTTLPWGLRVDDQINTGFPAGTLFHPTFLYESLWNVALCLVLVWLFHHRPRLQPGRLFPLYMIGYGLGRLWIESLRIDPANKIGPFRTNIWMSLLLIVAGATWFVLTRDSTARWPHPLRVGGGTAEGGDRSSDGVDSTRADEAEANRDGAARHDTARDETASDETSDDDTSADDDSDDRGDTGDGDADHDRTSADRASADRAKADRAKADRVKADRAKADRADADDGDRADADAKDAGVAAGRSKRPTKRGTRSHGPKTAAIDEAGRADDRKRAAVEPVGDKDQNAASPPSQRTGGRSATASQQDADQTIGDPTESPVEKRPVEKRPARKTPAGEKTAEKQPVQKRSDRQEPAQKKPAQKKPTQKKPAQKKPAQKRAGATRAAGSESVDKGATSTSDDPVDNSAAADD